MNLANLALGTEVDSLCQLASSGLLTMFDGATGLFCHRVRLEGSGLVREGLSRRYTMISLLGLRQGEISGRPSPVDVRTTLSGLLADTNWIKNLGDLGLLLWLCAVNRPECLEEVCVRNGVRTALARFPESLVGRTMDLAWFLTGLAYAGQTSAAMRRHLANSALSAYALLAKNQGGHGIFRHLSANKSVAGFLRSRIGSFADQVYPIYALTRFCQAYGFPSALPRARKCAEAICRNQGPLGQWWWHWDATTGRVLRRYPVYAVHQDGMAPMALSALSEAIRSDFSKPIHKGLAWITGRNELGNDLCDRSAGTIWRSIYRPAGVAKYWKEVRDLINPGREGESADGLRVLLECRPYHLGWLLYALAGQSSQLCGA